MYTLLRRQSWMATALPGRINRFGATPHVLRFAFSLLLTAPALGAWTVMWSRRRIRSAIAEHRRGWMQACPLPERQPILQQAVLAGSPVLAIATWPAVLAGTLMATGAGSQVTLNLAGCCLRLLVSVDLGSWPAVGREATADVPLLRASRACLTESFIALVQLRVWQRCVIGRLSLRRWVFWSAPALLITLTRAVAIQRDHRKAGGYRALSRSRGPERHVEGHVTLHAGVMRQHPALDKS